MQSVDRQFGILYPPWNHGPAGQKLLDAAIGEIGIDHLTVPAIGGPQTQFRLFHGFEQPYFHTSGGWHYPPQVRHYAGLGIRPRRADWTGPQDVLEALQRLGDQHGLKLFLRVDPAQAVPLLDSAGHLVQRSAWGQTYEPPQPCINHPEFRELLKAALAELLRYAPEGIEIAGLRLDAPPAEREVVGWRCLSLHLVCTCFCAACRQIAELAGIDPDLAARSVRVHAEHVAATPQHQRSAALRRFRDDPAVHQYQAVRASAAQQWMTALAAGFPQVRLIRVVQAQDVYGPSAVQIGLGADWSAISDAWGEGSVSQFWTQWARHQETFPGIAALHMRLSEPEVLAPADLVRYVTEAVGNGIQRLTFSHLEEWRPDILTWIKQAVRYARRG